MVQLKTRQTDVFLVLTRGESCWRKWTTANPSLRVASCNGPVCGQIGVNPVGGRSLKFTIAIIYLIIIILQFSIKMPSLILTHPCSTPDDILIVFSNTLLSAILAWDTQFSLFAWRKRSCLYNMHSFLIYFLRSLIAWNVVSSSLSFERLWYCCGWA